ncbi:TIGR04283 family arsenosugar biosynthesis glycosyltransferase [Hymenobacter wooponensis]|uniref:Glycosyltransferase n=1 Tax=Hymenobacter wooponensis TaxID=1525360 RepID=A0A4Z0MLK4_9BACT|nr:TIGR04283 family arsenosugar biosynthesis glycosyltransferase [Hymenobacter wooponensis]TGD80504.1 glycosyltransferase [Hymenobacter wooponensis]
MSHALYPSSAAAPASVSIIIPTYNEAVGITKLLGHLQAAAGPDASLEILVADAGSPDGTAHLARLAGARVIECTRKGRAAQLNAGAAAATGSILYFLHADTYPPLDFLALIRRAVAAGVSSGCFRLRFDDAHWFLRANAWVTRFDIDLIRFGDQSLFVKSTSFKQAGGFREDLLLMEDQEIIGRLRKEGQFLVLPHAVETSARKYHENGVFRLQGIFTLIATLHWLGVSQARLVSLYRRFIRQGKV